MQCRAMNECRQDVREAREAVEEILHHPTFLHSMCLTQLTSTQPGSRPMLEVSATLLESYERQLETIEGMLRVRLPLPVRALPHDTSSLIHAAMAPSFSPHIAGCLQCIAMWDPLEVLGVLVEEFSPRFYIGSTPSLPLQHKLLL